MLHVFYTNRVKLAGTKTGNDTQIGTEGVADMHSAWKVCQIFLGA
jgi:hypothetical protein